VVAREQDRWDVQAKRATFVAQQPSLDPTKLIFLDESGFRLGTPPNYGWAPKGEKAPGKATHGDWCTMTMLGAIALDGWRGFITIDAPTDGDVLLAYVQQQLAPRLKPGDIVVMDNLALTKARLSSQLSGPSARRSSFFRRTRLSTTPSRRRGPSSKTPSVACPRSLVTPSTTPSPSR